MLVLASILAVCILLVLHPFVTYPLSLLALRTIRRRATSDRVDPPRSFAILCCMYNERRHVETKVRNMLEVAASLPDCSIYVYSDASDDGTSEALSQYADRINVIVGQQRLGKTTGMNMLMSRVEADIVVFTDANVDVSAEHITRLVDDFSDPTVGCVVGNLVYVNADAGATAKVGAFYWQFEVWLRMLESVTGSAVGADGSLFAIRRELYRPAPPYIIDDFHTSINIFYSRHSVIQSREIVAYENMATAGIDEFRRKVRISCRAFNCHRHTAALRRKADWFTLYCYNSHKVLRWFSGFFVALGALCAALMLVIAAPLSGLVLVALGASLGFAATRFHVPLLSGIVQLLLGMIATSLGVVASLRGIKFQTWKAASSSRAA